MFENMSELPVTIMAIIIIVKIFLDYLAKKKDGANNNGAMTDGEKKVFYDMAKQVADLHEWHNKTDDDGRKVWYTRSSHEAALKDLQAATVEQTNVIREFTTAIDSLKGVIEHIENT